MLWEYLGPHKGAENRHQRVVLQVLSALDGHIQDVDGLLSKALQEKNKDWGQEGRATAWSSPELHIIRWAYLALILVQGGAGLPEEGSVFRHVGKAGDDVIKVPGGVGQRETEGPASKGCGPSLWCNSMPELWAPT